MLCGPRRVGNAIERVAVYECWLVRGARLYQLPPWLAPGSPLHRTGHIELQHDPKHRTKQY